MKPKTDGAMKSKTDAREDRILESVAKEQRRPRLAQSVREAEEAATEAARKPA